VSTLPYPPLNKEEAENKAGVDKLLKTGNHEWIIEQANKTESFYQHIHATSSTYSFFILLF